MDKFIIGDNPMREDSDTWIIHLLDPVAIIKCTQGHVGIGEVKAGNIYKHCQFRNSDGKIEEWTLRIHHFFTTDFLEQPEDRALKLLDRAWRWFRSYMEWEDKNVDIDEQANEN